MQPTDAYLLLVCKQPQPANEILPVLGSKPLCLPMPLLRCSTPVLELREQADAQDAARVGLELFGEPVYVIKAGSNITLFFDALDDPQTQRLELFLSGDPTAGSSNQALDGVFLAPHRCSRGNESGILRDSSTGTCNETQSVMTLSGTLSNAGASLTFCVTARNDQEECPPPRRRSQIICRTMHVPPPELQWEEPRPTAQADAVPVQDVRADKWELKNLTQASALPHTANELRFRMRAAEDIASGTHMGIQGLKGVTIASSPPLRPPVPAAPPPPPLSAEEQEAMRKKSASQWAAVSMRGSSTEPGAYNRLQMDLEPLYLLPSNHTLHFSGLKGSRATCDYSGLNGTNQPSVSTALPLASAHMVLRALPSPHCAAGSVVLAATCMRQALKTSGCVCGLLRQCVWVALASVAREGMKQGS